MPTLNTGNAILSNAITVDSSYNVGIGGSPSGSYKFEVTGTTKTSSYILSGTAAITQTAAGNANFVNNAYFDGTNWKIISTGYSSALNGDTTTGAIGFYTAASGSAGGNASFNQRMQISNTGQVNINSGTTNTTFTDANGGFAFKGSGGSPYISWHADNGTRLGYMQMQSGGQSTLAFTSSGQPLAIEVNGAERLRVTSAGQIYNSNAPNSDWGMIVKNANTSSGTSYGLKILAGTSSGDLAFQIGNAANDTNYLRVVGNGQVLINTTTQPSYNKFYTALGGTEGFRFGTWECYSYSVNNAFLMENAYFDGNFRYRITGYANALYSDAASGMEIRVAQAAGTDQVITWKNGATFAPNGNVYNYSNTTTWQQTSDITIKENVNTLKNALDSILILRPVTFDYKKEFSDSRNWEENQRINNIGFIAQEFELVFPKYVGESERRVDGEFTTLKNIDTSHLIPYLVKAIQELNQQLQDQQQTINSLINR